MEQSAEMGAQPAQALGERGEDGVMLGHGVTPHSCSHGTRLAGGPRQEGGRALTFKMSSKRSFPIWHHKLRWNHCPGSQRLNWSTAEYPVVSGATQGHEGGKHRAIPAPSPPKGLAPNRENQWLSPSKCFLNIIGVDELSPAPRPTPPCAPEAGGRKHLGIQEEAAAEIGVFPRAPDLRAVTDTWNSDCFIFIIV